MPRRALLIGNSDGIGLATTRRLLDEGWTVAGLSRSPSPLTHASYEHMAKGDVRPLMMSVDRAVEHLFKCFARQPVRYSAPWAMIPLVRVLRLMMWLGLA